MSGFRPVLTEYIQEKDCHTLSFYRSIGGYTALEKVLKLDPVPDANIAIFFIPLRQSIFNMC